MVSIRFCYILALFVEPSNNMKKNLREKYSTFYEKNTYNPKKYTHHQIHQQIRSETTISKFIKTTYPGFNPNYQFIKTIQIRSD